MATHHQWNVLNMKFSDHETEPNVSVLTVRVCGASIMVYNSCALTGLKYGITVHRRKYYTGTFYVVMALLSSSCTGKFVPGILRDPPQANVLTLSLFKRETMK